MGTHREEVVEIVIAGFAGRMGQEVARAALRGRDVALIGGLERETHPLAGSAWRDPDTEVEVPVASRLDDLPGLSAKPGGARPSSGPRGVLVEFCLAPGATEHALAAAEAGMGVVSGSTGLSEQDEEVMRRVAARVPVLRAPNFSRGAAALLHLGPLLAEALGEDYDVEIIEAHHRGKKDVPSGTALALAGRIASRTRSEGLRIGRRPEDGARRAREIGVHGVRAGSLVGEHRLLLGGPGESVELVHRVLSREAFARGVIHAARLVSGAPTGYYGVEQLLAEGMPGGKGDAG